MCFALHVLLTCASTWAIITLNKGHRLQCRAHRPSWSGEGAKRKARFNGNRAGGSIKGTFFRNRDSLAMQMPCNWLSFPVSVEQGQGVRYCGLCQTIYDRRVCAITWRLLQNTIQQINSNVIRFCSIRLDLGAYWVILQADRIIRETSLTLWPSKGIQLKIVVLCIVHYSVFRLLNSSHSLYANLKLKLLEHTIFPFSLIQSYSKIV